MFVDTRNLVTRSDLCWSLYLMKLLMFAVQGILCQKEKRTQKSFFMLHIHIFIDAFINLHIFVNLLNLTNLFSIRQEFPSNQNQYI